MSFVCYYQCDGCRTRHDGDLTPPGWTDDDSGKDFCKECTKKRENDEFDEHAALLRQSAAGGEK